MKVLIIKLSFLSQSVMKSWRNVVLALMFWWLFYFSVMGCLKVFSVCNSNMYIWWFVLTEAVRCVLFVWWHWVSAWNCGPIKQQKREKPAWTFILCLRRSHKHYTVVAILSNYTNEKILNGILICTRRMEYTSRLLLGSVWTCVLVCRFCVWCPVQISKVL